MKLLFVSNVFPPGFIGGYELGALDIARFFARNGHQVTVLTTDYLPEGDAPVGDGVVVERSLQMLWADLQHDIRPSSQFSSFDSDYYSWSNVRRLADVLTRFQPDAVVMFNIGGIGTGGLVQFVRACGVPTLLYFMDNVFSRLNRESVEYREFVRSFGPIRLDELTGAVSMSRRLVNDLSDNVHLARSKIAYIPGWAGSSQTVADRPTVRAESLTRFVFSSRVAPHKGTTIMLDAAAALRDGQRTEFTIDVFGAGQVTEFLGQVRDRGLQDIVHYRGVLPKEVMQRKFAEYDALLFPTWEREPFGFVVPEAAAAGCVPVMTMGIGASEWFSHEVDSVKIERTVEALAAAMRSMMDMGPEQRCAFRCRAQGYALSGLSLERWMPYLEAQLTELVQKGARFDRASIRRVRAAHLVLGQLCREALGLS
jgi:glycogen synthase